MSIIKVAFTKKYQAVVLELLKIEDHPFLHDTLREISLEGMSLSSVRFHSCLFSDVDFSGATFSKDTFTKCYFIGCPGIDEEAAKGMDNSNRINNTGMSELQLHAITIKNTGASIAKQISLG